MADSGSVLAAELAREGIAARDELAALLPVVYLELKRIAHGQMLRLVAGSTLSTTVLVHETYLRLAERNPELRLSRSHFVSLCARVMRQVVADHAREQFAEKRGGDRPTMALRDTDAASHASAHALASLAIALDTLSQADPPLVRLIEQHWFLGLDSEELAKLHQVSQRTIQRDLRRARAWVADLLAT